PGEHYLSVRYTLGLNYSSIIIINEILKAEGRPCLQPQDDARFSSAVSEIMEFQYSLTIFTLPPDIKRKLKILRRMCSVILICHLWDVMKINILLIYVNE
ncbi:hypothetical protein OTU49_004726, partial [Cherax quadricarinatus]